MPSRRVMVRNMKSLQERVCVCVFLFLILMKGVGAQGGDLDEACLAALDARGMGLLIPVSRGISKAADPGAAAVEYRDRINAARVRERDG